MFLPKNEQLLATAYRAWQNAESLRTRRSRYKQYTYGEQWNDPVEDENGRMISEGELARRSGKRPMTNNLIRQLVKCVVGRFRNTINELDNTNQQLHKIYEQNNLNELDSRMLEEFLISGCAIQRINAGNNGNNVWIENVNPARFFVNDFKDPRGWDIELIGMLHDMSIAEVIMRFSCGDRAKAKALRQIYANKELSLGGDFFKAATNRCRVIEMWTLECDEMLLCHDRQNGEIFKTNLSNEAGINQENINRKKGNQQPIDYRWHIDSHWQCRYFAPDGTILDSFSSPYRHGSHPFVIKFYPLIDGEVHSFVEDVIDQQRYVNRLIVMIDHIMSTSAKGALLFPANQRHESTSWEQIATQWAKSDGIIPYNPSSGVPGPQQIAANNTNIGAFELLQLEMKLFEDVSGVSNALMGKNISATTGSVLYESQIKNATIALADIFETFNHFRSERDKKAFD